MNPKLLENNYIVLPGFIDPELAKKLSMELHDHYRNNGGMPCDQVEFAASTGDYPPLLELLIDKIPEVTALVEEKLIPTYVRSRVYYQGAVLPSHTDRGACEIGITVHLNCDKKWIFWIETPEDERRYVDPKPGDGILYLGIAAPHGRIGSYTGQYYSQIFMHYVRSQGNNIKYYFDKYRD